MRKFDANYVNQNSHRKRAKALEQSIAFEIIQTSNGFSQRGSRVLFEFIYIGRRTRVHEKIKPPEQRHQLRSIC
ncbi:hypothetical protein LSAT2_025762 [Lamellibrachia satsuma]|nr:hypothetical protein LSAT2_025762 [Lamellibrachia satsuma]